MINIILYPTIFIGIFLIIWAITLYILQFIQPQLTRESDIILSTITSLCGGILFFQGWRLDPLLFTCYSLLVITIILLSLELLQLRKTQSGINKNDKMSKKNKIQPNLKIGSSQGSITEEKTNLRLPRKYNMFLPRKNNFTKPKIYDNTIEEKS